MQIIPTINCKDFKCVKERIIKAGEFLPKFGWIQIDISDGKFTKVKTWSNAMKLQELRIKNRELRDIKFEVHLMVEDVEKEIKKWGDVADRIIIHVEAMDLGRFKIQDSRIKNKIGVAIKLETPVEEFIPILEQGFNFRINQKLIHINPCLVQLLAVKAGYSGQKFDKDILKKIKWLKKNFPKVRIEIDGGVDLKTAKLIKKAGADIAVVGSYIFESKNPGEAYESLKNV